MSTAARPAEAKDSPEKIKKAAKEMESMFAYEMIKSMNATVKSADKSLGGDTYKTLFDMELSKILAERGLGLQNMLIKGMTALSASRYAPETGKDVANTGNPVNVKLRK